ncbi:hypothetical protein K504DRAFT_536421 [Pleomassaria siparia CBS 279.74]|uniref:Cytochrome P450 n=1 Tax=Pleomassaria siparia CBS 279.74 TaxID=1314801 RepID=A0A6G1K0W4_9PLEO|nr:hypothetical protein K504DRAFT_536421 [Pleomassaria siparia CBS 279.74]
MRADATVPGAGDTEDGELDERPPYDASVGVLGLVAEFGFVLPWIYPRDQIEASQPFPLGTRSCLGRGLAWLELRLTLAKMIFRYDMELADDDLD